MGVLNFGGISDIYTKTAAMLKHSIGMGENLLVKAKQTGNLKHLMADAVIPTRNAMFGTEAGGYTKFKTRFDSAAKTGTYDAYHNFAKETIGNWWQGKSLSGRSEGHTTHRAVLRQAAVYGGGLMVGASMLNNNRRRR